MTSNPLSGKSAEPANPQCLYCERPVYHPTFAGPWLHEETDRWQCSDECECGNIDQWDWAHVPVKSGFRCLPDPVDNLNEKADITP